VIHVHFPLRLCRNTHIHVGNCLWGLAHLPSTHKALNSNPRTAKKKNKRERDEITCDCS
jgi:hypothetical protein